MSGIAGADAIKRAIRKLLRGSLLSLFMFFTTLKIDKTKAIKIAAVTIKSEQKPDHTTNASKN